MRHALRLPPIVVGSRFFAFVLIAAFLACDAATAASPAASSCKLIRIAEWPVKLETGRVLIDGAVNGQKIDVMLDTGAASTMIFRSAAERLNLPQREAAGIRMFGVGGETKVFVAHIDEFRLGTAVRNHWNVYVVGRGEHGADFLLGGDFFQSLDVEFDFAHNAVRLYQAKDCEGVSLAYWATTGIGTVELEAMDNASPKISVPVEINGRRIMATLDTGAPTSIMERTDAARMGVTPETPGVVATGASRGIGDKEAKSWLGTFKTFVIGNETIRDAEIFFSDMHSAVAFEGRAPTRMNSMASMLLGLDFLMAHRVLVAHSQQKVYFTHTGDPVFEWKSRLAPPNESPGEAKTPAKPVEK
jgi:clan AA aspartic protease (TIGR02281 family)